MDSGPGSPYLATEPEGRGRLELASENELRVDSAASAYKKSWPPWERDSESFEEMDLFENGEPRSGGSGTHQRIRVLHDEDRKDPGNSTKTTVTSSSQCSVTQLPRLGGMP